MGEFIRNCRLCRKQMESGPFMMCTTCLVESDRIRSFITKNPYVSVEEISLATNVSVEKVERMVDLGVNKNNYKRKSKLYNL
ncbi:hypothetical protein SAMN05216232_2281 [Virgibacillus subterraneus]|uniref:Flagellar protein n=1 Tax=Virgibacillus subterraneus TaxID=621109 RepID=A0A1H9FPU8_9BACI|nr:hypothetical protein [Virgibacillus subterraneus]SEQ39829.1 hypothetical protein SAMN05216232_2281 [Virgibacillus subterraneus]